MNEKRIAIVGRDAPLWLAALALHRALAPAGYTVTAVELPSQLSEHHAYAASPALNGLHALIGVERREALLASGGIAVGGQRHSGWSEHPYFIAFDGPRPFLDGVDVLQHWVAARANGAEVPLQRLSLGAVALARGKVGIDRRDPLEFGAIHRGSHLDAQAYSAFLRAKAVESGIEIRAWLSVRAVFDEDRLVRIEGLGGKFVEADLFVDASGPDAVLSSARPDDDWQDWRRYYSVRTIWRASAPALRPYPPFTDLVRDDAGWSARVPLANRTAFIIAREGDAIPDAAAVGGTSSISELVRESFEPGYRTAWQGNVLALGDANCRIEQTDLLSLHMLHAGIANLIAWVPAADDESWALREHLNGVLQRYAESARDFQLARYRLGRRSADTAPWPEMLEERIALFAARGRVSVFDDETFDEGLWSLQLAGLGIVPRTPHPRARRMSEAERQQQLARLAAAIESEVARMPTVAADLAG